MRKCVALAATLVAMWAFASPAAAASGIGPPPPLTCHPANFDFPGERSTGPCVETDHFSDGSFIGTPLPCSGPAPFAGGWVSGVFFGTGVQHVTVNSQDDAWLTFTFTGTGTFYPILPPDFSTNPPGITPDPTRPAAAGQLTEWFGLELNSNNFVFSDTTHFIGQTLAPFPVQSVDMHFDNHANSTGQNPFVPRNMVHHLSCA
jgi:hypothetical protein